ncbi:MAG: hypothetical protein JW861_11010 [Bacteroidales bacterium]|nr:hypothetical protein [Bacteroidales bacterium]
MKRNASILILCCMLGFSVNAQQTISFRFANPQVIKGTPDIFQFDIEIKANTTETYHRDLQIFMEYNPEAFGTEVVGKEHLKLEKLLLMEGELDEGEKYRVIKLGDIEEGRVVIMTELGQDEITPGAGFYNLVPDEFTGFLRITMNIENPDALPGIRFQHELMEGGEYYTTPNGKPLKYDKTIISNDLMDHPLH